MVKYFVTIDEVLLEGLNKAGLPLGLDDITKRHFEVVTEGLKEGEVAFKIDINDIPILRVIAGKDADLVESQLKDSI